MKTHIKYIIILLNCIFLFQFSLIAQTEIEESGLCGEPEIFAQFPGGETALDSFISSNIIHPHLNSDCGIQCLEIVYMVVEKDGTLSNIKIIKSCGKEFDKETLRLIELMPKWVPGELNGDAIRMSIYLPVKFKIE